jgi:hypothetical protein
MNAKQMDTLVDEHWSYIERLFRAYNEHVGNHPEVNLRWMETDYKEAMKAGLRGEECPSCRHYPATRFQAYNISTAHQHGLKHRHEAR